MQTDEIAFSPDQAEALNARFDTWHPRDILQWAAEKFPTPPPALSESPAAFAPARGGLVMTSSFGADSMCSVHLATQVKPDIPIIFVNTGYLFPETLLFMTEMQVRFGLNISEFKTRNDPVAWLTINGEPDPRRRNDVDACCAANKNEVFDRAMRELAPAAWIRGVRADQSEERGKMKILQWNNRYSCWVLSPILRWSKREVFYYMKEHGLPHNPLWEKGYVSIGCSPETCTRPVAHGDDQRAGRWSGMEKKECGIHLDIAADI